MHTASLEAHNAVPQDTAVVEPRCVATTVETKFLVFNQQQILTRVFSCRNRNMWGLQPM